MGDGSPSASIWARRIRSSPRCAAALPSACPTATARCSCRRRCATCPTARAQVGRQALAGAASDPKNTIVSVKRLMGRGLADLSSAGRLAYDFVEGAEGMVQLRTAAGVKSPVEVSAEILATLRQRAEDTFDAELYGAVITVPAYFDDAQRQATKDAAELARHRGPAPDQRADRGGDRLRARERQRGPVRRLRPRRRHVRHLASCA